jgi:hypothetical protein
MINYIDHHKWLVNNNILTDQVKDTIAMCGYCLIEDTKDVGTSIDFNNKVVSYRLLVPAKLYDNVMLLDRFNNGEKIGFFESLRLKKFIKAKKQNDETGLGYNIEEIGNRFIRNYLTKEWSVKVKLFKENSHEANNFWNTDDNADNKGF